MLVTKKNFDVNDVVTMKLVNGDEIVVKIVGIEEKSYKLHKPMIVVPSAQGIGMLQALFTGKMGKEVEMSIDHIMMMTPTEDEVVNHYIAVTTGIQPVTAGSIIT